MEGILAIDPAGPMFETNSEATRLTGNDAKAVQVFHTNSNGLFPAVLGYDPPCGSVDFYFNGALNQPGCDGDGQCAHAYGFYFLLSLNLRNNASSATGYRYGFSESGRNFCAFIYILSQVSQHIRLNCG